MTKVVFAGRRGTFFSSLTRFSRALGFHLAPHSGSPHVQLELSPALPIAAARNGSQRVWAHRPVDFQCKEDIYFHGN